MTSTPDPLGGSWYVEALTDRLEQEAYAIFARIDAHRRRDCRHRRRVLPARARRRGLPLPAGGRDGDRVIVGVNRYVATDEPELLHVDPIVEERQIARLEPSRRAATPQPSRPRWRACGGRGAGRNVMPALVECSDAYASLGEMCDVLRGVWGVYRETPVF